MDPKLETGREKSVSVFSTENRVNVSIYPQDVFILTDAGSAELRGGATSLPPGALAVLVLLDGKATVGDVEQKAQHMPSEAVRDSLRSLLAAALVRPATIEETDGLDFSAFFNAAQDSAEPTGGAKASADREADRSAPELEKTGYYVSIARQAVKTRKPEGRALCALVVEDDPDVSSLVARLLQDDGIETQVAATPAEIVARLRTQPAPDVIILDINLPGVSGFQVLSRLKSNPGLKAIPVIMLTAEAKRESVMRGLAGGADGYITKPFDRDALRAGVRAVLGVEA